MGSSLGVGELDKLHLSRCQITWYPQKQRPGEDISPSLSDAQEEPVRDAPS